MKISSIPLRLSRQLTPEALFSYLSHQPWSIWLDSCNSEHIDSQFDIMVFQPHTTLVTTEKITEISSFQYDKLLGDAEQTSSSVSNEDPLTLVREQQLSVFKPFDITELEKSPLPFKTGSVGLFSYDLGRRFEKISTKADKDIALADMAVGIYVNALVYDHKSQEYFLVAPKSNQQDIIEQLDKIIAVNQTEAEEFTLTTSWQANMNKAEYKVKFDRVQQALLDGDCYQVNLAQRFSASYCGDEFTAYKKLRQHNNAPFSAFMKFERNTILSLSPERFLRLKNNQVQSKPIKGTMPRGNTPESDRKNAEILKSSEKDRAENLMIVDLLRNDISKVCKAGTVKVPTLFDIESFPAVHHLVSTVEGELEQGIDATDLLRGAFPGGSITGAPKISSMEVIEALEPQRRSLYCGSIGYFSVCGNMDTSITIRTLICEKNNPETSTNTDNKIYCWAGGGLVADSNVDAEYQETFDKVNKILPILTNN